MTWSACYSSNRTGYSSTKENLRSDFKRDYDRLIFSTAFRRLQNKTQVFPLPGSASFVHNRLTHSLEVASVGRSLGSLVGEEIAQDCKSEPDRIFYMHELSAVISAGCLAHDVGNPAFGHSGEKAIAEYFSSNHDLLIDNQTLREYFNNREWADLTNFEGNANALRILTKQFTGKQPGGLNLTYTTLSSILKYPCESIAVSEEKHRKKYGVFQSEKEVFQDIVKEVGMIQESVDPIIYRRHPFVYLVEAADDICYSIIDLEDAHRIGIISTEEVTALYLNLITDIKGGSDKMHNVKQVLQQISDKNESVAFLRAKSISELVKACSHHFITYKNEILQGSYQGTLIDDITDGLRSMQHIKKVSIDKIYNHDSVIKVEIAGYRVMSGLLEVFIPSILSDHPRPMQKKAMTLLPKQFLSAGGTAYEKVMSILDFISGMTDGYAMDMYRKFMGIDIAEHM